MDRNENTETMLGSQPVGRLLVKFSIPGVISLLSNSLYNMVDQIFIGNFVGELGNAATNIAFPLTTLCAALSLLYGNGGATGFNLSLGRGEKEKSPYYIGNSTTMLLILGVLVMVVTLLFLTPLLRAFGSPDEVLPYAQSYVGITAFGFPFIFLGGGAGYFARADGRPRASLIILLAGAIANVGLDALFVVAFRWGIRGAAAATVIGQVVTGVVGIWVLCHMKTVKMKLCYLIPKRNYVAESARLGLAPCLNQLAMMAAQIVMNNSLNIYGGMSVYGESIPIAVAGIATKVNQVSVSILGGVGYAVQPIASFNFGAKKYERVRTVFRLTLIFGFMVGAVTFLLYQLLPVQLISLFGEGSSEVYYQFAIRYFRIFLMLAFINFMPLMVSTFFTSIGKPMRGTFVSLSRQVIFFIPPLIIFPLIWGIDGLLYAGPVADALSVIVCIFMLAKEFRELRRQENE